MYRLLGLLATLVLVGQSASAAQCTCEVDAALAALRHAGVIVEATVQSAERREDGTIVMSLEVAEFLRGGAPEPLQLITPAPPACGVRVRLAYGDVYFFNPGQAAITYCQGIAHLREHTSADLGQALRVVTHPNDALDEDMRRRLGRQFSRFDGQRLQDFFTLVAKLDAAHEVITSTDAVLEYRQLRVHLGPEGTYESLEVMP